jgi:hypothetical protein
MNGKYIYMYESQMKIVQDKMHNGMWIDEATRESWHNWYILPTGQIIRAYAFAPDFADKINIYRFTTRIEITLDGYITKEASRTLQEVLSCRPERYIGQYIKIYIDHSHSPSIQPNKYAEFLIDEGYASLSSPNILKQHITSKRLVDCWNEAIFRTTCRHKGKQHIFWNELSDGEKGYIEKLQQPNYPPEGIREAYFNCQLACHQGLAFHDAIEGTYDSYRYSRDKTLDLIARHPNTPPTILWQCAYLSPLALLSNPIFPLIPLELPEWQNHPQLKLLAKYHPKLKDKKILRLWKDDNDK